MENWGQFFYPSANAYKRFTSRGGEQEDLYNQYRDAYLGGSGDAAKNAAIYQTYAKNLFANQPNQFAQYQDVGNYLFGNLDKFRDTTSAAGNRDMNSRLALLGIKPGSTSYDRLLNANRITSNLMPAYQSTVGAIAPGYNSINANSMNDTLLRLGLANDDALNQYMDRIYERPLDVAGVRGGQIAGNINQFGNLIDQYNKNIAGYKTEETSDLAKYGRVFDRWASSYGGGSSSPYQAGPGAGGPQMYPQNQYYSQNPYLNQLQDSRYMQEFNGVPPPSGQAPAYNPYQIPADAPTGDFGAGFGSGGAYTA